MEIAIIFDLDGTLLDTLDDLCNATNYALSQFGCPLRTREEVRRFVGNGVEQLLRRALPGQPDDPPPATILPVFRTYYQAHCQQHTAPYPGICTALQTLTEQFPVAIVSNKPDAAVRQLCQQYFGSLPALGETPGCPRKPAPDMLLHIMNRLQVSRCIYVGDSEVDIRTAQNAGVPCLSVTWGFRTPEELYQAGAQYYCPSPDALPACLKIIAQEMEGNVTYGQ